MKGEVAIMLTVFKFLKALFIAAAASLMFVILASVGAIGFGLFIIISLCTFIYKLSKCVNSLTRR